MEKNYFDEIILEYNKFKNSYKDKINSQKELSFNRIKTKGKRFNILPYTAERLGNKLKGKEIDEIEMKDDNYIYHFDKQGNIRLVEEASTFLKKISKFECYDYIENKVYSYCCTLSGINCISLSIFNDNIILEKYIIYEPDRFAYEEYQYCNDILKQINVEIIYAKKESRRRKELFFYDNNQKLMLIQRIEEKYKYNEYSEVNLNYKKIELNLENEIIEFNSKVSKSKENTYAIQMNLNTIKENPSIDIYLKYDEEIICEKNILLRKFPLDDAEKDKILNSILKTILKLWNEKYLNKNLRIKILKESTNILNEDIFGKLPKWFKNQSQLCFENEEICCEFIKEQDRNEIKEVRTLFKELKSIVNKKLSLNELIDVFADNSKFGVKESSKDVEELFKMQVETVFNNNKFMLAYSLVRQVPFEDEFIQLGMEIIYELDEKNKLLSSIHWSDEIEYDFFEFVRKSDEFKLLNNYKIYDIRIFLEET